MKPCPNKLRRERLKALKTDRLIAITMYLLNRGTVSASALAERFEVSKRTIQRDMDVLSQAGIPIVSTFGTDGGYAIIDGFRLAKQIAGAEDYLHIITALKGLRTAYGDEKTETTLKKALTIMQGGEQHVFIDFSVARENVSVNRYLPVIEKAIHAKTLLRLEYTNAEGGLTIRTVEPLALSFQWYAWYAFAYCTEKKDYRLFKLPRISRCEPVDGLFSKEHGDIEALMKNKGTADNRKIDSTRVLCKGEVRQQILEYLRCHIIEERKNGDFVIEIRLPFERMWFSLLMGFGDKVRVLDSDDLKKMLKQKAEEIFSLY